MKKSVSIIVFAAACILIFFFLVTAIFSRENSQPGTNEQESALPQTNTEMPEKPDEENKDSETPNMSNTVDLKELQAWYGETVELKNSDVPKIYTAEMFSNINIDAEVHVPEEISFGKLQVSEKRFNDHKRIKELFISGSVKEESTSGGNIRFYYSDDGASLSISHQEGIPDCLRYYSGGDSFNSRVGDVQTQGYNSYRNFVKGTNTFIAWEAGKFFDQPEIPDFSIEDAVNMVKEKADALEITYYPEPQIFVIDSKGVSEYRENFKEQYPGATLDETEFTSEDDAYLIFFNLACEGMPVCTNWWFNYEQMTGYDGGCVYGVVNRKGLLEFYANPGYTLEEEKEKHLNLYNADIVEKVINKQFNIGLETNECTFTSISLEYLCTGGGIESGESLILEPCWTCQYNIVEMINNKETIYTGILFIKASTGELLKTDGGDIEKFIDRGY